MAILRHLPNAPITEALIDIHVEHRVGLSFAQLQGAFDNLDFGYYVKGPIAERTLGLKVSLDGQPHHATMEASQIGLRLHSSDEKYVAQCRLGGFTLSRLPPYLDWQALVQETRRVWAVYCERLAPIHVTRVATRFINNLRLPLGRGVEFQAYLQKFADVPEEAPQALASFFQSFQLVDIPSDSFVNLTLALESVPQAGPAPVILDIDAFAKRSLNPRNDELWDILEHLRVLKNQCFFGSLTEQAVELYE